MKYEHTHLSVKVTATGNTAREMSRWSDAARTEYLCDQAILFLNGKRPDLFVEVVDLKAVELERCVTDSDMRGSEGDHAGSGRGSQSTTRPGAAGSSPAPAHPPAPEPVDAGGEWPRWVQNGPHCLCRFDSQNDHTTFYTGGLFGGRSLMSSHTSYLRDPACKPATPTQAAEWLEQNGHAKVADELEGEDRFEPVGTVPVVGDAIHRNGVHYCRIERIEQSPKWGAMCWNDKGAWAEPEYWSGAAPNADNATYRILKRRPA